jgi:uncharacterized protein (DUF2252 family)
MATQKKAKKNKTSGRAAKVLSADERRAQGKALRHAVPREVHGGWKPSKKRRDPVEILVESNKGRLPDLVPIRFGRMSQSPFAFYRGGAAIMAADLAVTPSSGLRVQACGDAHLMNFGGFATPERQIIFDINDLDETLPAPWEWDLKRLATSFVVASRDNGLSESAARDTARRCARSYREAIAEFSQLRTLELWYQAMWLDELVQAVKDPVFRKRGVERMQKEQAKSIAEDIFPKLVEHKGEIPLIRDQLPTIFHLEGVPPGEIQRGLQDALAVYRSSLPSAYQVLLNHYELRDAAIKVVGVGSVGTKCWVFLFTAGDDDPLFLQIKEARPSVLEAYARANAFPNQGQRIVHGYRLMQPAGDIFLGWSRGGKRDYFVRQLRDIKLSIRVETFGRSEMALFATWCGKALALSHARSGGSAVLRGYMGKSDAFDKAMAAFSVAYADQNEKDHAALARAIRKGTLKAEFEKEP